MAPQTSITAVTSPPPTHGSPAELTLQTLVASLEGLPAFLSVPEAGQLAGLSRSAAYRAAERGELPTVRLAGRLQVPIGALLSLMGLMQPMTAGQTPWAKAVTGFSTADQKSTPTEADLRAR